MSRKATLATAPATEPLTRAEAKLHLLIATTVTAHDDWVDRAIISARQMYEHDTDSAVISSTWKQTYCDFYDHLELYRGPVSSITSIQYYDANETLQTWASTNYRLDDGETIPRIVWDDDAILPTLDNRPEAVIVTYVAGYTNAAAVPADIKNNILMRIKHEWELHVGGMDSQIKPIERAIENMTRRRERSSYP